MYSMHKLHITSSTCASKSRHSWTPFRDSLAIERLPNRSFTVLQISLLETMHCRPISFVCSHLYFIVEVFCRFSNFNRLFRAPKFNLRSAIVALSSNWLPVCRWNCRPSHSSRCLHSPTPVLACYCSWPPPVAESTC